MPTPVLELPRLHSYDHPRRCSRLERRRSAGGFFGDARRIGLIRNYRHLFRPLRVPSSAWLRHGRYDTALSQAMLGSAFPAPASVHTATAPATPTSPTRSSRLRGLSYLRSYTHNHLHRDSTPLSRTASSPGADDTSAQQPAEEPEQMGDAAAYSITSRTGRTTDEQRAPVATRTRAVTSVDSTSRDHFYSSEDGSSFPLANSTNEVLSRSINGGPSNESASREGLPTIRFIPHFEARSPRPSLQFAAVQRALKNPGSVVRVGRYSERDNVVIPPDGLPPIGFKSKVVSRRHCEFWCTNGQWYVKDVKSSSGTFLNHVRLSAPGTESRPFPVKDGDVVQLGIDFKGGEELIFRCVKMRIQCNRGWQKSLNSFNTSAHRRLLKNALMNRKTTRETSARDSDTASIGTADCSICLNAVEPCQALFIAPCGHVWHYKCVASLLRGPIYPNFICPNCRFVSDLEADVEPAEDLFGEAFSDESGDEYPSTSQRRGQGEVGLDEDGEDEVEPDAAELEDDDEDAVEPLANDRDHSHLASLINTISLEEVVNRRASPIISLDERGASTASIPVAQRNIRNRPSSPGDALSVDIVTDGPMTPRNDIGPFVLDGAAGDGANAAGMTTRTLRVVHDSDG